MDVAQREPDALDAHELLMEHKQRLDQIAGAYDPSSPSQDFDYWFVQLGFETMSKHLIGETALELGCSTGLMTERLSQALTKIVVVDGSSVNVESTRRRLGDRSGITYIHELWEDFEPRRSFENIILVRGLEHVKAPVQLLSRIRNWLEAHGRLHVIVPNALSLHRRIGVYMGLLREPHDLHEGDLRVGHQRVYDRETLFHQLRQAGLTPGHWEGIMLKPLSNSQMLDWPEPLIRAFHQAGRELPDYCGEIYVWCSK